MNDSPLASRLLGKTIGTWQVTKKRKKDDNDNSGYWSTCYTVENEKGELGFLKAYNYTYAFQGISSSADVLKGMVDNFTYERDLLKFCKEYKMRRVVTAIGSGEYTEPGETIPVPYLIFEIAQGNIKTYQAMNNPDVAWKLRCFHGSLVGLSQLHSQKIVHQDIKPSNILIFGNKISKIGDLGSATQLNNESIWGLNGAAGDLRYAPVELLYGYFSPDWSTRRLGGDLFMMGGLITYLITDSNFLSLMLSRLPEELMWRNFGGTYEQIIPHLMKAYNETLLAISRNIPDQIRDELVQIIGELSYPIPEKRGNPRKIITSYPQYSLVRYISVIDRLSIKVSA